MDNTVNPTFKLKSQFPNYPSSLSQKQPKTKPLPLKKAPPNLFSFFEVKTSSNSLPDIPVLHSLSSIMGGEVIRYGGEPNLEVVPTGNSNKPYRNLHVIRPYPVPQHYLRPEYGGKFTVGGGGKASGGGGGVWCFSDPEMKRKKRVASYKAYGVEGKLKAKIRKGFRWIKNKCSDIVRGC